jgi:protein O-GlcNAc transferase
MVKPTDLARLQHAVAVHQSGDLRGAAELYTRILKDRPRDFNALHLLGVIRFQEGNLNDAESLLSKSIKYNSASADAHYFLGRVFWQKKLMERARFYFKQCVRIDQKYENALISLGCIAAESENLQEAIEFFKKALAVNPRSAQGWFNCAVALLGLKRFNEALEHLDKAIAIEPRSAEAMHYRAVALHRLEHYEQALAWFDKAIAIRPTPDALVGRGMALQNLGRAEEALPCYDQALGIKPDHIDALLNRAIGLRSLRRIDEAFACIDGAIGFNRDSHDAFRIRGETLQRMRRYDEALACFDRAIALEPNDTEALIGRGVVLKEQGRLDAAAAWFEQVSADKPDLAEAHYHLGIELYEQGRRDQAVARLERALATNPGYGEAKIALCMAQLPVLYTDVSEIEERRTAYQQRLTRLREDIERNGTYRSFARAVGSTQPFLLAYQGYCDRSLQALYGSLVCRAMAERYPPAALPGLAEPGDRVRLGIVSGFFCGHSNWKIPIKGWLGQLDRNEFQLSGYYTGSKEDAATMEAAALCDRFVRGPMSMDRWRQTILADAPHVLIYPEIGMDRVSSQLAAQRLAPVQCNSWGHPETSGYPTLDYYLSSELMEPPDGCEHYTERLVRLPNLSIYYEPPEDVEPVSLDRQELGLRTGAIVYWCGQSLYKYLPQLDDVFPRIARQVGDCQFVFIQYQSGSHVTELFKGRLERAFTALGMQAQDYCIFLPRLGPHQFLAAVGQSDVVLDSIGWTGCNSTLESLVFDLPIVTLMGSLMRGRHTAAILTMMSVAETIAQTVDDYVSIAIRLALDAEWRVAVRRRINENKYRIYRDRSSVAALGEFLNHVARKGGHGGG